MKKAKSKDVSYFILMNVSDNPRKISKITAEKFGISRQAVNRYIQKLIKEGRLEATGKTRDRIYKLKPILIKDHTLNITPDLEEDRIWRNDVSDLITFLPDNVLEIFHYGFTEMFNNVLDHSEASLVHIRIIQTAVSIELIIYDNGIGIFKKISDNLKLEDHRHAIFELTKGKLTTDPEHHTGEGIFFTSRMFEIFSIVSSGLIFSHLEQDDDWLIEYETEDKKGTFITLKTSPFSMKTSKEVFDKYSDKEDYSFNKTHVPVKLLKYGKENLISRSQAKRLLARFDKFKEIYLDFEGINMIGQAFADEIFRVFRNQYPHIHIRHGRANKKVERVINRVMLRKDNFTSNP